MCRHVGCCRDGHNYSPLLEAALVVVNELGTITAQQAIRSNIRNAAGELDATGLVSPECLAAAQGILKLKGA